MRPVRFPLLSRLFAVALCAASLAPRAALAKGSELDTGNRVFPYNGTLENNGEAFSGTADLQITVTDNSTCTFSETHNDVQVASGRFALKIGEGTQSSGSSSTGVSACVFNATAVYLKLAVRNGTSTGSYATLSGSQRIYPVPFSYWSAEGSDLAVDNTLTVNGATSLKSGVTVTGAASVSGALSVTGAATVAGGASITGTTTLKGTSSSLVVEGSDIQLGTNDGRTGSGSGQYAVSHSGSNDSLMLNYGNGFSGGVEIHGPTKVGNARPASGKGQLTLNDNWDDTLDDVNDYQIVLNGGGTSATSTYGIGVQSNTVFVNSADDFKFMDQGVTKFQIDGTGNKTSVNTDLTVYGYIRGKLKMSVTSTSLSAGDKTLECPSGSLPISCNSVKDASGEEDVISCRLNPTGDSPTGCFFRVDESGGSDANRTGYCNCLSYQ